MAGEPYAAGGIRTTVAATRAATDEQLTAHVARLVAEMRRAGHHDGRDQERLRAHRPRRGAQPGRRAAVHRRDHVPRRPRRARRSTPRTRPAYVDAGHRADAGGGRAARPVDRRVLRDRAPSTPTRPAPCCAAGAAAGLRGAAARQPARPGPRRPAGLPSSAWPPSTTAPTSTDADVDALARLGHRRHPAARRGVLHPSALPRRPPAARRRRHGGAGQRLQPRLLLHLLDAALHRPGGAGDGDDPRRGGAGRDRRRRRGAGPRRRRRARPRARGPTWSLLDAPSHLHLAYRPGVPLVVETWIGDVPSGPDGPVPGSGRLPTSGTPGAGVMHVATGQRGSRRGCRI